MSAPIATMGCIDCGGVLHKPNRGRRIRCFDCTKKLLAPKRQKLEFSAFSGDWAAGVSAQDIAKKHGVGAQRIYQIAKKAGAVERKRPYTKSAEAVSERESRARQMMDSYAAGLSLDSIAEIHGITRERVRQIISARGMTRFDGGQALKSAAKKAARAARVAVNRDERCMRVYGCFYGGMEALLGKDVRLTSNKAARAYVHQKRNSDKRGIEFSLTFPQWWGVWQKSGKWEQRGRGHGYVMARNGDVGSYSVGNVYICTQSQNSKDSYIKTPASVRAEKARLTRAAKGIPPGPGCGLGGGRGWVYIARCKTKPYQVVVGRKYVGMFATPEEAHAAYLAACEKKRRETETILAEAA